jgi:hypothetical protein
MLVSSFAFSRRYLNIEGLSVTQSENNQIKVNLKVVGDSFTTYTSDKIDITDNVITLAVCYKVAFIVSDNTTTHLNNDFFVTLPNDGNYTLNVNIYEGVSSDVCDYSQMDDAATLDFSTPIEGVVALNTTEIGNKTDEITLFPNPANGILNIETLSKIDKINVYDASGKQVLRFSKNAGNKIDVSKLNNGVYHLEIFTDKGKISKKLLIQK